VSGANYLLICFFVLTNRRICVQAENFDQL